MTKPSGSGTGRREEILIIVLFCLLAYFPIFLNLDSLPIRVWDEARNAISAFEMYRDGDPMVVKYGGEPDMWSVKPPILIWAQCLLFHLIGPGELAVRLFPAICAFLTGWSLFRYCWRDLGKPWLGLFCTGILFSSTGFVNMHGARSGDYDAPMILFMCWSLILIFRWSRSPGKKIPILFFLVLGLGALTKSIQALLYLPGILLYLGIRGRLGALLKDRRTYIGIAVFLLMIAAYYVPREILTPGYLQAVWEQELWGRFGTTLSGHRQPWDHYLLRLIQVEFNAWYLWVPVGIYFGATSRDEQLRHWTLLMILVAAGYLLVISSAQTKLIWYSAPAVPLLSMLAGIGVHGIILLLQEAIDRSVLWQRSRALPYAALLVIVAGPWAAVVSHIYSASEFTFEQDFYRLPAVLQLEQRGAQELDVDAVVYDDYDAHLKFYTLLMNEEGDPIRMMHSSELRPGMRVLAGQYHVDEYIRASFVKDEWGVDHGVNVFELYDRKSSE